MSSVNELCLASPFHNGAEFRFPDDDVAPNIFHKLLSVVELAAPKLVANFRASTDSALTMDVKVEIFNSFVKKRGNKVTTHAWNAERCDIDVAKHIVELAMFAANPNYAEIKKTKRQNDKQDNYGEVSLAEMGRIVQRLQPTENDVFGDIGSGIGQVVCFVAAATTVKSSFGIEYDTSRAEAAVKVERFFASFMKFFAKKHGMIELVAGSVFDEWPTRKITEEATVLFANNYSFPVSTNLGIEEMLKNASNGLRIVSTVELAKGNRRDRTTALKSNSFLAMVDKTSWTSATDGFSWGSSPVPLYMCTVNLMKLQLFFDSQKPQHEKRKRREEESNGKRRRKF